MAISDLSAKTAVSGALSVVICTRNRPDKIGAAVTSVLANDYPAFDLTVIDQSTTDATERVVRSLPQHIHPVKYVHMNAAGLSRAYNLGVKETTAPIIAFTDDDCIVPEDWLQRIAHAFSEEPEAELLYGQVVPKPLEAEDYVESEPTKYIPALEFSKQERLSRQDGFKIFGMGANFAARRHLMDRIGGFDEVLGGGGPLRSSQDFDFEYRAFRAGAIILLRPEVTLLHDGGRDPGDWLKVMRNYGVGDGAFYSKHVRCGDFYALTLLLRMISKDMARVLIKPLLGRHDPSRRAYVIGFLIGIRDGLKFSVERSTKRYSLLG